MKIIIQKIAIILVLNTCAFNAYAEIKLSNTLAKDIGQAYGFYLGQDYSLEEIAKKYPAISSLAFIAEQEFLMNFKSSIEGMDMLMEKHAKSEWDEIKRDLATQIKTSISIEEISESQARQFVALVRERAKGNIDTPVIETLLLFKSGYTNKPAQEFLEGYKYKYVSNGSGKAKGVGFSIEYPKTWMHEEGNRPNIVQKFVSERGQGLQVFLVLIKNVPLQPGEVITEQDILEILNPNDIQDFIPANGVHLSSGKLTLENLPGFWVHFKVNMSRARTTGDMEAIMYTIFYEDKMIMLQGQIMTTVNGEPRHQGEFAKYEQLFDLMANSLVIPSKYK